MKTENFHVAYITDNNYAMPTAVSIISLLENKADNVSYVVHLILDNVSDQNRECFKEISYPNCEIDIIDADSSFYEDIKDGSLRVGTHVSPAALIKFNLPNIFPNLNTLLYLDGDIIITQDISELFTMDISNYGLAASLAFNMSNGASHLPQIGSEYFSSGVMLLNLKKMREENMTDQLIDYKKNGINFFMDNDAFCVVFYKKTLFLPLIYNFNTATFNVNDFDEFNQKALEGKYLDESECIEDQKILHLQGKWKPWKYWMPWTTDIFIHYHKLSPYKNEPLKLKSPLQVILSNKNKEIYQKKEWRFPREKIAKGSKIILYGAGEVGQTFYDFINDTGYCEILLWVDGNFDKINAKNTDGKKFVHSPDEIKNCLQYDYVLIASIRYVLVVSIKKYLKNMGVSEEKIITT